MLQTAGPNPVLAVITRSPLHCKATNPEIGWVKATRRTTWAW